MKRTIFVGAAAIIFSCTVGEQMHEHEEDDSELDLDNALLVSSRDHLEVCLEIEPAIAAQTDQLVLRLETDLQALRATHPDWQVAGLDAGEVHVVLGCPGGAMPMAPLEEKAIAPIAHLRSSPSSFRTHVHVLSDASAQAVLGDRTYGRAVAEVVRVGDDRVAEVSTAILVRASQLGTAEFRATALAEGIGLRAL